MIDQHDILCGMKRTSHAKRQKEEVLRYIEECANEECSKTRETNVDLWWYSLESVPRELSALTWLTSLTIRLSLPGKRIKELPDFIGDFPLLEELTVYITDVSALPESLGKLKSLKKLYLSFREDMECDEGIYMGESKENHLFSLPESFGNLSSLEELYIEGARLKSLPESFGNLTALKSLEIYGSELKTLPGSFGKLAALERFSLCYEDHRFDILNDMDIRGGLDVWPESIGNLRSLKALDLCGRDSLIVPETLGNLSALQKLHLMAGVSKDTRGVRDIHGLIALPESLRELGNLRELSLACGRIEERDGSLGTPPGLRALYITGSVSRLPESIGNLSSLKRLWIEAKIKELPDSIGNLSGLRELSIYANNLKTLPDSIGNLSGLRELWINADNLKTLPDSIGNLSGLRELSIYANNRKVLPGYRKTYRP
jgi:Leucine-rich repeat (LRR) protein